MKAILATLVLFSLALAQNNDYQLVWYDEFNGNSLDRSKWQYEVNCDGGGNNELQCYTNRADNLYLKDGYLHIRAKPENYNNKGYTSARINTANAQSWKYGRFVTRAKVPRGDYLWPAIWMMPKDSVYGGWAASGEIDIMETRGQTPRVVEGTIHHGSGWPNNVYTGSGPKTFPFDFTQDFHVFELIWERDQIQWLVDGQVYHTQNLNRNFWSGRGNNPYNANRQPFDQRFFFILNLAIGGGFFGNQANALTQAMARGWQSPELVVDYVRVYQQGATPINPPPVPVPTSAQATSSDAPKPSQSIGVSTAKSSAASSAISTAATSGVTSAESSAQTTFYYSEPQRTSAQPPRTSAAQNDPNACPNGCGSGSCCNDVNLGGVCFSTNTHECVSDPTGFYLCGKGAGYCKQSGCYNKNNYKCVNGVLAPL